ncbi:hypothetical protein CDAR_291751 [Caerostris darwini]|uniref:Uncharacterized protein n=1 Tax=Caerostris darwini TaxID=1538125 RepID=A0AAV4NY82_9ARAC|nr:hypothetical protein CDAR_291751 [Caerostris darwini]
MLIPSIVRELVPRRIQCLVEVTHTILQISNNNNNGDLNAFVNKHPKFDASTQANDSTKRHRKKLRSKLHCPQIRESRNPRRRRLNSDLPLCRQWRLPFKQRGKLLKRYETRIQIRKLLSEIPRFEVAGCIHLLLLIAARIPMSSNNAWGTTCSN